MLLGGKEITTLLEHVGEVEDKDTFAVAFRKVEEGIMAQTSQATARFKLYSKGDSMRAHTGGVRQEKERVARLEDKVRQLEFHKGGINKACRTCTCGGHEGKCPGLNMTCFSCNQLGHMKISKACK